MIKTTIRTERAWLRGAKRAALVVAVPLALLGLLLALSIRIKMPTSLLMVVRIGATELSPWLALMNLLAALLSVFAARSASTAPRRIALAALICSLTGCILAATPVAQAPAVISDADAAMQLGLGSGYASHIPAGAAASLRPSPFSFLDALVGIKTATVSVARDLPYRTVEGKTLLLDRYDPPGIGPHPGLLVIHGGSWRNGNKGEYAPASYYFAERGYVVYDIQYRLSSQGFQFPAQLDDVECALGYIRTHAAEDKLDPERVVLFGRSAGAHLALLAAYRNGRDPAPAGCGPSATVKAVVGYYAPTDLRGDYTNPADPDLIHVRDVLGAFLGGSPEQVPDRYASATPQNWLDRPVPPTLLIHGESDQIVLPRSARKLESALRASHNKVVTITIPWAGHGFDAIFAGPSSQIALYYWERFMAYVLANP